MLSCSSEGQTSKEVPVRVDVFIHLERELFFLLCPDFFILPAFIITGHIAICMFFFSHQIVISLSDWVMTQHNDLILNWFTLYYIHIMTQTGIKSNLLFLNVVLSFQSPPYHFIDTWESSFHFLENTPLKILSDFTQYMYLDRVYAKQYSCFESLDVVFLCSELAILQSFQQC